MGKIKLSDDNTAVIFEAKRACRATSCCKSREEEGLSPIRIGAGDVPDHEIDLFLKQGKKVGCTYKKSRYGTDQKYKSGGASFFCQEGVAGDEARAKMTEIIKAVNNG